MKLTKQQVQVLVALHLVIVMLITGLFFMPITPASASNEDTPSITPPYIHDKYRTARPAFSEDIMWETNIGGSGEESVENTYQINNNLIILGNTTSTDYDFDENSGGKTAFMATVSTDGTPVEYKLFEGSLCFSALFGDGILLFLTNGESKSALLISPSGDTLLTRDLSLKAEEEILDLVFAIDEDTLYLIVGLTQATPPYKKIKVITLSRTLQSVDGAVLTHPYDLEYIAAYPHGEGLVVAANIDAPTSGCMVLFEYRNGTALVSLHENTIKNRPYKASGLLPYMDGYAAPIIDNDGILDILLIDYATLKNSGIVLLSDKKVESAALYGDGSNYFIFIKPSDGVSQMHSLSSSMSLLNEFSAFSSYTAITAFSVSVNEVFFAGKHSDMAVLSVVRGGVLFQKGIASGSESIIKILPFKNFLILVCTSSSTSIDVGGNFGQNDVWIAKISY